MSEARIEPVLAWLEDLQDRICAALEEEDGQALFDRRELAGERGGRSRPRVLEDGPVVEKAAVNLSHARGGALPPAATERRPELAGRSFQAASLSLIVHPRNPHAPTTHMNLRCFVAGREGEAPVWWFGGGFDLTPYYGYREDVLHWHRTARQACQGHGEDRYRRFKQWCDEYFYLPHRDEPRGVGGLFFDDLAEGDFAQELAFVRSVGEAFLPAYRPLLARRKDTPYGADQRHWQLVRRGRYVEFNLVWDRGTRYGLQSGGRIESILASLPAEVRWRYDHHPAPDSPEAELLRDYLVPRPWLDED